MVPDLVIDNNLLETAFAIGRLKTQKDTVNLALDEFIQRRKRQEVIDLFGTIEFDKNDDYKKSREKKMKIPDCFGICDVTVLNVPFVPNVLSRNIL
ncbi:MAG: type II toxin-antitoxin system VapB family antitoxin [Planctomycetaceae bacterium]|jgi:Arc/MetJ family transcription regulator|nr:type II toxin-antitoxin system VapB family antitoxin [Planctomycetaceae bacterium]